MNSGLERIKLEYNDLDKKPISNLDISVGLANKGD